MNCTKLFGIKLKYLKKMQKLVLDRDIQIRTEAHNDGFNFSSPRILAKDSDSGVYVDFITSPFFLRRAIGAEGVDMDNWEPPNLGKPFGLEPYVKIYAYNCPKISFKYELTIYSAICRVAYITNFDRFKETQGISAEYLSNYEDTIDKFIALDIKGGKTLMAHCRVWFDYGGIADAHRFIKDSTIGANYVELKDVILNS